MVFKVRPNSCNKIFYRHRLVLKKNKYTTKINHKNV